MGSEELNQKQEQEEIQQEEQQEIEGEVSTEGGQEETAEDDKSEDQPEGQETQEEIEAKQPAPQWVKDLRKENRALKREMRELKTKDRPAIQAEKEEDPGPKPTLEEFDYDTDAYEEKLAAWMDKKRSIDASKDAKSKEEKDAKEAYQSKVTAYAKARESFDSDEFDEAEENVLEAFSEVKQGILVDAFDNPAEIVFFLGKNKQKLDELAKIKNPVQYVRRLTEMTMEMKSKTQDTGKPASKPEKVLTGGGRPSGAVDGELQRLQKEADRTGDRSKVIAYQRSKRSAA